MKLQSLTAGILAAAALVSLSANAENKVAVHGSVQADILFPEDNAKIGTKYDSDSPILFNTYADVNLASKYVDAGLRFEFMKWPLPGYPKDFKGWGFPNIYVKGKFGGVELTAGTFYEQFGSGFILRTYEERTLGIDNSILGGRLKINAIKGLRITALGGVQRVYWDWKDYNQVYGADVEGYFQDWIPSLRDRDVALTFGASWVMKNERNNGGREDILISGTDYRLKTPKQVNAFDGRIGFNKGSWNVQAEYAWKGQDPSYDNDYTYNHGQAIMLTGSYSRKGLSATLQAKRSQNMSYRTERWRGEDNGAFINYMPAFTYQHTYSLPAIFPYATQYGPGEWAFNGSFGYTFPRKSPLGGKYGTNLTVNLSYISSLVHEGNPDNNLPGTENHVMGTNGYKSPFWKMGPTNYWDFNLQLEKRLSRPVTMQFMYMNQLYNRAVIEGEGGKIYSNILVLDTKWKINRKFVLRGEVQYMFAHHDKADMAYIDHYNETNYAQMDYGDWFYALAEFSWSPYLMFSASDMINVGGTGNNYYMFGITGTYRSNRLMLSYGQTRSGYNCSGGMCRYVPAMKGFQLNYTYNF